MKIEVSEVIFITKKTIQVTHKPYWLFIAKLWPSRVRTSHETLYKVVALSKRIDKIGLHKRKFETENKFADFVFSFEHGWLLTVDAWLQSLHLKYSLPCYFFNSSHVGVKSMLDGWLNFGSARLRSWRFVQSLTFR